MHKTKIVFASVIGLLLQLSNAYATDTTRIYFDLDKKDINYAKQKLDSIIRIKDIFQINVIGYTDYLGSVNYNLKLSQERANAVKNYLSGILRTITISAEGKGELTSLVELPEGDHANRRVDIIITKGKNTAHKRSESSIKESTENRKVKDISEMEVGETIVLGSLHFIGGRHFLLPHSEAQLVDLYNELDKHKNVKIEIQGHVCCTTDKDGYDYDSRDSFLSVNRAKYIYERLIDMGIEKSRLRYIGYGSRFPKSWPEITDQDKSNNRRVEIKILSK